MYYGGREDFFPLQASRAGLFSDLSAGGHWSPPHSRLRRAAASLTDKSRRYGVLPTVASEKPFCPFTRTPHPSSGSPVSVNSTLLKGKLFSKIATFMAVSNRYIMQVLGSIITCRGNSSTNRGRFAVIPLIVELIPAGLYPMRCRRQV